MRKEGEKRLASGNNEVEMPPPKKGKLLGFRDGRKSETNSRKKELD